MENVVAHPDKVEIFLPNIDANAAILSSHFHDLARVWTSRWGLQWRDKGKDADDYNRWKSWEIVGVNDHLQIVVHDSAYHVRERSRDTRTFFEEHWIDTPFPTSTRRSELYTLHRHLGWIRLTDQKKDDPVLHANSIFTVLRDIEAFGLSDFPRRVEVALDCADGDLARDLRLGLRLKRGNDADLVHFFPGLQSVPFRGPGLRGDREYQHFHSYPATGLRQLTFYPRWENGFYRVELRLGPRSLRRYVLSTAFREARPSGVKSPTLQVLATMPTIIRQNVVAERLDLPRLHGDHPGTRALGLDGLSIRGQRYTLRRAGFSHQEINRYSVRLDMPPTTVLTPDTAANF